MYLAFIDESGDPGLRSLNPEYPVFALAAVVCLEREYATRVEPQLRQFMRSALGSDVTLSARGIAKQRGPFAALLARDRRRRFAQELSDLLAGLPITVIAACLNKRMHHVSTACSTEAPTSSHCHSSWSDWCISWPRGTTA